MKKCCKCLCDKLESDFGLDKYTNDGLNRRCKNCSNESSRNRPKKKIKFICEKCLVEYELDYYKSKKRKHNYCLICSPTVVQKGIKRPQFSKENSSRWKGGEYISSHGYKMVKCDGEFYDNGKPVYKLEHILVYEKFLGRKLETKNIVDGGGEQIHHINGDKLENTIDNLLLCENTKEHKTIDCQLHEVAFELVRLGIIQFDKNSKLYSINKDKINV